jgi:hypothetical protein
MGSFWKSSVKNFALLKSQSRLKEKKLLLLHKRVHNHIVGAQFLKNGINKKVFFLFKPKKG